MNGRSGRFNVSHTEKLIDLEYYAIVAETDLAYGFDFDDGKSDLVWIPKSQCEIDEKDRVVTMKEALAVEKEIEGNMK